MLIKFTIFTAENEFNDEEMFINNTMNDKTMQLKMRRVPRKKGWLHYKYGKNVVPWECRISVPNENGDATGSFVGKKFQLKYNYEQMNTG